MKSLIYLILPILTLICSCDNNDYEFPDNCQGYSAGIYKHGYAFAEGTYQDFGDYAIFIRERVADTINGGWTHDPVEKSISLNTINPYCSEKQRIRMTNLSFQIYDTIWLNFTHLGLGVDYPTGSLRFMDADASYETYHILESGRNWLLIDDINSDTSEITGKFNLSFITSYEPYLTGEKERWDDPNRPDTLRFTNGEFRAVFADF
jgi:hypothetical protein